MPTVDCRRCEQTKDSLPKPPFGGALGESIQGSVCSSCWSAWIGEQTKIINEHRLSLGDPRSQEILDRQMRIFLKLDAPPA